MNFRDHEKKLQALLRTVDKTKVVKGIEKKVKRYYPGVYFIRRSHGSRIWKVGMSINIFQRLKSYKICWAENPDQYVIDYIVIAKEEKHARLLEKLMLSVKKWKPVEVNVEAEGRTSKEYRISVEKKDLSTGIRKVLKAETGKKMWSEVIVFQKEGWTMIPATKAGLARLNKLGTQRLPMDNGKIGGIIRAVSLDDLPDPNIKDPSAPFYEDDEKVQPAKPKKKKPSSLSSLTIPLSSLSKLQKL